MIEVKNLTKRYGQILAVDDLSFTVKAGEIVGFLGPNGAGKTTTLNIMTGYLAPTEGSITINGFDIVESPLEAKTQIGYLPDHPPIYPNMTVWEYLNFVADLKKVKRAGRKEHLEEIMELVKVTDMRKRITKNLSKGYRQRVGLCQAMVGSPSAIILDEPMVALDPMQIIEMRQVIRDLGKRHTLILSSHILPEVSAVCDRVMIIHKGRIVASDSTDRLTSTVTGQYRLQLRVKDSYERARDLLSAHRFVKDIESQGSKEDGTVDIILTGEEGADIRELAFKACAENDINLLSMKSLEFSLEEIFLEVTNSSVREGLELEENAILDEAHGGEENIEVESDDEQAAVENGMTQGVITEQVEILQAEAESAEIESAIPEQNGMESAVSEESTEYEQTKTNHISLNHLYKEKRAEEKEAEGDDSNN